MDKLQGLQSDPELFVGIGTSWATDVPYRETQSAIRKAEEKGVENGSIVSLNLIKEIISRIKS